MHNRIKQIRQGASRTQAEFAESLGLSRNYIAMIETGQREPSDRTIADICRVYNVDEHWLRTGEGEPFLQLSREDALTAYAAKIAGGKTTDIERRIIHFMAATDVEEWEVLAAAIRRFADEINKPDTE